MAISNISHRIIEYSFYFLLFFVPLFITPLNYELFEYNKIMLTYALTVIIVGAWLIKMVSDRKLQIQRTPMDIPIILFLISQVLSTFFSIDRHVSIWGYYSRFHGGLLSTIAYFALYYAAVSNLNKGSVIRALQFALLGGVLVAAYGVAEHFGIDAQYWVQDVKNRVFSSLGQPNWLAAYLSILIPLGIAFGVRVSKPQTTPDSKHQALSVRYYFLGNFHYYLLLITYYLALLYTKSRSGFTGFWVGLTILGILLFLRRGWWRTQFERRGEPDRFLSASLASDEEFGHRKSSYRERIGSRKNRWQATTAPPLQPGFTLRLFLISILTFLILTFFISSPFEQINKYFSLSAIREKITHVAPQPSSPPPPGGTESGEIRKIVWKGAVDVWQHYPILGSGVETFAFSYYQYRPVEHNMVSEWDFLYNKAHNEYLNFLATTGALGLGSYLLLIGWFLGWNIKLIPKSKALNSKQYQNSNIKIQNKKGLENLDFENLNLFRASDFEFRILILALFAGYASILVSNFFGFSVVVVALFFFLIPAFSFILSRKDEPIPYTLYPTPYTLRPVQYAGIIIILLSTFYLLLSLSRLWQADVYFAKGYNLGRIEDYSQAYKNLKTAIEINPREPLYRDELSGVTVILAVQAAQEKDATEAAKLAQEAIIENQKALEVSPNNVNFWKTRTRVFYTLAALNEDYNKDALEAIKKAWQLAPTDAKISYNLAVVYGRVGEIEMAKKTLEETIKLKPDYRDAHYALALYLKAAGKTDEANSHLEYILEKISPDDEEVKELLDQPPQKPN